jgi:hypothetical protein
MDDIALRAARESICPRPGPAQRLGEPPRLAVRGLDPRPCSALRRRAPFYHMPPPHFTTWGPACPPPSGYPLLPRRAPPRLARAALCPRTREPPTTFACLASSQGHGPLVLPPKRATRCWDCCAPAGAAALCLPWPLRPPNFVCLTACCQRSFSPLLQTPEEFPRRRGAPHSSLPRPPAGSLTRGRRPGAIEPWPAGGCLGPRPLSSPGHCSTRRPARHRALRAGPLNSRSWSSKPATCTPHLRHRLAASALRSPAVDDPLCAQPRPPINTARSPHRRRPPTLPAPWHPPRLP